MRSPVPFLSLLLLAGCAGVPAPGSLAPAGGPFVGRLELMRPVAVPAGRTRVFFQGDGEPLVQRLDLYRPHCNLEVRRIAQEPRVIPAGNYPITRVGWRSEEVVERSEPVRLAGPLLAGMVDGDGYSFISRGVVFWLEGGAEVSPLRLTCYGGMAEPASARYPLLSEVTIALTDVAILYLEEPHP